MKATQLYPYHLKNAKLTEFAGYEMPLWYTSNTDEHLAVRNSCGIFDVSHMGRFAVKGEAAGSYLEGLVPTHVQTQPVAKSFYTLLLNDKGGIIDDLIVMRRSDTEFLVVVNAANAEGDMKHMQTHRPAEGVEIEDRTSTSVMIAVQGPKAQQVLQPLTSLDLGQLKRFRCAGDEVLRHPSIISRTGYTGEDGFEVIVEGATNDNPGGALKIWEELVVASKPCGLAARDSLRLEAGFPLHGSDIDQSTDPYQADLSWVIATDKKDYVGYDALVGLGSSPTVVRRGAVLDRGIPRHGFEVLDVASKRVGSVTSGTFSPILKRGIALCRVKQEDSEFGREIKIRVRDRMEDGRLVKPPFYDGTAYGWKRSAPQAK